MEINTNYYPLVSSNEYVEITKPITELTAYDELLEKSIMYAACNNKYLSYYNPSFITRTSDNNFMHHTINTCDTNKTEFILGYNRFTGGLYSYFGGEHANGFHGHDITLIRKFKFTDTYINLDSLNVTCLTCEHANMVGSSYSLDNDKISISLNEYITRGYEYPIISWNALEIVNAVANQNTFPVFCKEYDYSYVYTPTPFSFRSNENSYISAGASWGNVTDIRFYGVQTGWDNSNNTTCGFYLNNQGGTLSCNHVLGIPSTIDDFATPKNDGAGHNPSNGNYFIPNDYDWSDTALPIIMYDGDWQSRYYHGYSYDYFIHMIASLGLRFKLNNVMYASEIDKNGYTTGRFIPVSELPASDFANKEWVTSENSIYDRDYIPDKPIDDNITPIHTRYLNELTGFIKYYKMTNTDLDRFLDACESAGNALTGFEYMPYIVSIMQYPFNVSDYVATGISKEHIQINGVTLDGDYEGHTGFEGKGYKLESFTVPKKLIGSTTVSRLYNNFLDYAPYTNIEIYIPLCGYVTLPSECMGKTIDVYLINDIISGSCKGVVYCEGIPVSEKNGTLGQSVTITGTETGIKRQALLNNAIGLTSAGVGLIAGATTGNSVALASSGISAIGSVTQAMATANNSYTRTAGKTGTATDFFDSSNCYIKITRPVVNLPSSYGHSIGYISNKTTQLINSKGFTIVNNPDISGVSCDYAEGQEIKSLLNSGVIIK